MEDQRGREVRDERKGVRDIDHQRRKHRRKAGIEVLARLLLLARRQFIPAVQQHPGARRAWDNRIAKTLGLQAQGRHQLVPQTPPQCLLLGTSVITSKPAIRDHFKTGQRNYSGQEEFYRIFTELSK
jgi:hypothetical protein